MQRSNMNEKVGASRHILGALALALSLGGGTGCVSGAGSDDGKGAPTNQGNTEEEDCRGTLSGAVTGTFGRCVQTSVTETQSGRVTHGFVGVVGEYQVTVMFDFETEPPAPGTYDWTNLSDYQATVGFLGWSASWDAQYDEVPEGDLVLNLTGGSGARLEGTVEATAIPVLADESTGNVDIELTFPL
jgi:hypothetical protein